MCSCISSIEKFIQREFPGAEKIILDVHPDPDRRGEVMTALRIKIIRRMDGQRISAEKLFRHQFCPFCGGAAFAETDHEQTSEQETRMRSHLLRFALRGGE